MVNAQLLTLTALLLFGGALGDRVGRKRVFIAGAALFSLASVFSGLAPTIGALVAFQAVLGVGSALMIPQSLAIINACFAENERGRAIGLWAGLSGALGAVGPLLVGWLIQSFSWRAVFFVAVPVSAAAIITSVFFVPESKSPVSRKLDWPGTMLIFAGLLGVAYGLITGPLGGWTQYSVLAAITGGGLAVMAFVFFELHQVEPVVPPQIFRNPLVAAANAVTLLLYFGLNGMIFLIPLNLQQIQGYPPTAAGFALLLPVALIAFGSGTAGALADRIGPRLQMILGPAVVASGAILLGLTSGAARNLGGLMAGLALVGMGMALVIAPLTKSALGVESQYSGIASGVNNAVARFAALLAVAVIGAVMFSAFVARLHGLVASSTLSPEQQIQILDQASRLGGIVIPDGFGEVARSVARHAITEAFAYGFRWVMGLCTVTAAAAAIVSALSIRRREQTGTSGRRI